MPTSTAQLVASKILEDFIHKQSQVLPVDETNILRKNQLISMCEKTGE